MSQAMESVTRAFYARSDLDLILSSPAAARKIFAVRIGAMALSVILMAALLGAPLINVLVARGGVRWLGAYGVVVAMGATAAALAVALTVALFRTIGPKRTRLAAQIVAAVIAAVFIIGLQVAAILSHGTLSRMVFLESDTLVALVPEIDSLRLVAGARRARRPDGARRRARRSASLMLGAAILVFSARFGDHAIAASSVTAAGARQARALDGFRRALAAARAAAEGMDAAAARSVARVADPDADPLPAAARAAAVALLRRRHRRAGRAGAGAGDGGGAARGRARLARDLGRGRARSGGDRAGPGAATSCAPRSRRCSARIATRVRAVHRGARASCRSTRALVAALGILAAAAAATGIQFWFRKQATRRYFRHRQTASRFATFAEAFSSISWAATAALAAGGSWAALFPAAIGVGILLARALDEPAQDINENGRAFARPSRLQRLCDHRVTPRLRGNRYDARVSSPLRRS